DTYQWYLDLGPLSNINAKYLHGKIPYWNSTIDHPDYDDFWKKEAWVRQLHASTVPNLNVAGFWDQEDPWGPWQIFRHAEEHDPERLEQLANVGSGAPERTAGDKSIFARGRHAFLQCPHRRGKRESLSRICF